MLRISKASRIPEFAVFLLWLISATIATAGEQPNFVVILADDCTFRDIGCYGGQALTPNIDRLAREGMKFERCFQAAPMCSPTRHNLYTGLYPVKSGAYPNHTMIYPDVKTIGHYLLPLGYRVAHTGKLHVNPKENFPWTRLGKGKDPAMQQVDRFLGASASNDGNQQPFCLFACSSSPHSPWTQGDATVYPADKVQLPPYLVDTAKVRRDFSAYLAEISHFDSQVGEIVAMLDQHGLRASTLVMVLSEQGNSFPFAKWTCYDHGLQSAMVVRWPGQVEPGSVSRAMVEYVDVTPTLVEVGGGATIEGLDGSSFLPVMLGQADRHKDFVYGIMTTRGIRQGSEAFAIRSIRDERYKLIVNLNHETKFVNACTHSDYFASMVKKAATGDSTAKRLVDAYHHRPPLELFDLKTDPLESTNLADAPEQAARIADLRGRLEAWMADQGDLGVLTEKTAHLRRSRNQQNNRRFDPIKVLERTDNSVNY